MQVIIRDKNTGDYKAGSGLTAKWSQDINAARVFVNAGAASGSVPTNRGGQLKRNVEYVPVGIYLASSKLLTGSTPMQQTPAAAASAYATTAARAA